MKFTFKSICCSALGLAGVWLFLVLAFSLAGCVSAVDPDREISSLRRQVEALVLATSKNSQSIEDLAQASISNSRAISKLADGFAIEAPAKVTKPKKAAIYVGPEAKGNTFDHVSIDKGTFVYDASSRRCSVDGKRWFPIGDNGVCRVQP